MILSTKQETTRSKTGFQELVSVRLSVDSIGRIVTYVVKKGDQILLRNPSAHGLPADTVITVDQLMNPKGDDDPFVYSGIGNSVLRSFKLSDLCLLACNDVVDDYDSDDSAPDLDGPRFNPL